MGHNDILRDPKREPEPAPKVPLSRMDAPPQLYLFLLPYSHSNSIPLQRERTKTKDSCTEARVAAIPYIQVRKGMVIVEEGQLQFVVDRDLNTPGNWRAILQLKLRSLKTG